MKKYVIILFAAMAIVTSVTFAVDFNYHLHHAKCEVYI